jgi:hypothetical protein
MSLLLTTASANCETKSLYVQTTSVGNKTRNVIWKNYVFGICPSFDVLKNTTFRKLDLFPSSGKITGVSTLLGALERASLNHWTTLSSAFTSGTRNSKEMLHLQRLLLAGITHRRPTQTLVSANSLFLLEFLVTRANVY